MRAIDQILRNKRTHERRIAAAEEAVDALTKEERALFAAGLIERVEKESNGKAARRRRAEQPTGGSRQSNVGSAERPSKLVDQAESHVIEHPGCGFRPMVNARIGPS